MTVPVSFIVCLHNAERTYYLTLAFFPFLCNDVGKISAHKGNNGGIKGYNEGELYVWIMQVPGGKEPEGQFLGAVRRQWTFRFADAVTVHSTSE